MEDQAKSIHAAISADADQSRTTTSHSLGHAENALPCLSVSTTWAEPPPLPKSRSAARVLIADRDQVQMQSIMLFMSMIGFARFHGVSNRVETIRALSLEDYTIVLLDDAILGESSFCIPQIIRSRAIMSPNPVPLILVFTNRVPSCNEEAAYHYGADYALRKPVTRDDLHSIFLRNAYV